MPIIPSVRLQLFYEITMLNGKNILVTGATGFVAYNIAKKLCANNQVYCIIRPSSNTERLDLLQNIHYITYDGSLEGLAAQLKSIKIDITYHLASLFIAQHTTQQVDNLILSNVLFPTQLLEVLTNLGFNNFVNTGTIWQEYSDEDYDPVCLYAATKQSFEDIIKYYHKVKQLNCITLRIYDTYGHGDWRKKLFWLLKDLRQTPRQIDMPPGEQKLNLVYIDDVVNAFEIAGEMLLAGESPINSIYGVYGDSEYSLREIFSIFEKVHKCKFDVRWGAVPYRTREIMQPTKKHQRLPAWAPEFEIEHGVKQI